MLPSGGPQPKVYAYERQHRGAYSGRVDVCAETSRLHARDAEASVRHAGGGDFCQGLELVARRRREEVLKVVDDLKWLRTKRMTAAEGTEFQSYVRLTDGQLERLGRFYLQYCFGRAGVPVVKAVRALRNRLKGDFTFSTFELTKGGQVVSHCALQQVEDVGAAFTALCRQHEYVPEDGQYRGCVCFAVFCDRGGGGTRAAVAFKSGTKDSAETLEYLCKFTDAPDDYYHILNYVIAPNEPHLAKLRGRTMLVVGAVTSNGARDAVVLDAGVCLTAASPQYEVQKPALQLPDAIRGVLEGAFDVVFAMARKNRTTSPQLIGRHR